MVTWCAPYAQASTFGHILYVFHRDALLGTFSAEIIAEIIAEDPHITIMVITIMPAMILHRHAHRARGKLQR